MKHNDYSTPELLGSATRAFDAEAKRVFAHGLPTSAEERKATPIYSGVIKYFPLALAEVARVSKAGNDQHNPGQPLHWSRGKSGDHLDALTRHLADAGTIDTDGMRHSAKVAWRALANLQEEMEREQEAQTKQAQDNSTDYERRQRMVRDEYLKEQTQPVEERYKERELARMERQTVKQTTDKIAAKFPDIDYSIPRELR